jgi:hypothetical protein
VNEEAARGGGNRRRYLRYADGSVNVRLRGSGLLGRFRTVEEHALIDYNRYGLAFLGEEAMAPDTELVLDVDAGSLSLQAVPARVRVCEPRADGYRIGVEFGLEAMREAAASRLGHSLHELEKALKRR